MADKLCVCGLSNACVGSVVMHADHIASHAYDEEKERALFEATFWNCDKAALERGIVPYSNNHGRYVVAGVQDEWLGWVKCAKSRAKAAGCL